MLVSLFIKRSQINNNFQFPSLKLLINALKK